MIRYILPYENITTGGAEILIGHISEYIKIHKKMKRFLFYVD